MMADRFPSYPPTTLQLVASGTEAMHHYTDRMKQIWDEPIPAILFTMNMTRVRANELLRLAETSELLGIHEAYAEDGDR